MTEFALRNKEYVVPIAVALIGLVGTIAGLWVGYRRWLEDKRVAASKGFYAGRQEAYQQLWDKVEGLNVDARIERCPRRTTPNGSRKSTPSC